MIESGDIGFPACVVRLVCVVHFRCRRTGNGLFRTLSKKLESWNLEKRHFRSWEKLGRQMGRKTGASAFGGKIRGRACLFLLAV